MDSRVSLNSSREISQQGNSQDHNFAKITFLIATIAIAFFAPVAMCWGAAVGFAFQLYKAPPFKAGQPVITIDNTLVTLVGCTAALLRSTPAGRAGGLLFRVIPFFGSTAIGATIYRFANIPLS